VSFILVSIKIIVGSVVKVTALVGLGDTVGSGTKFVALLGLVASGVKVVAVRREFVPEPSSV